jgi:hypothetical protein
MFRDQASSRDAFADSFYQASLRQDVDADYWRIRPPHIPPANPQWAREKFPSGSKAL